MLNSVFLVSVQLINGPGVVHPLLKVATPKQIVNRFLVNDSGSSAAR